MRSLAFRAFGTTNATTAKQLSGWFNVETVSIGDLEATGRVTWATGAGGINIIMEGYAPGFSVAPFNYTNFNTYTTIWSDTPWPWY